MPTSSSFSCAKQRSLTERPVTRTDLRTQSTSLVKTLATRLPNDSGFNLSGGRTMHTDGALLDLERAGGVVGTRKAIVAPILKFGRFEHEKGHGFHRAPPSPGSPPFRRRDPHPGSCPTWQGRSSFPHARPYP